MGVCFLAILSYLRNARSLPFPSLLLKLSTNLCLPPSSEVVWLRRLLCELGVPVIGPTPLNANNTSAIQIANNPVFYKRTKHIEVDCQFIWEHVLTGVLHLPHVSSQDQLADLFTKAGPRPRQDFLTTKLMLRQTLHQFKGECRSGSSASLHDPGPPDLSRTNPRPLAH